MYKVQTFTPKELDLYIRFERVRVSGAHNMLTREARNAMGLSDSEYAFVLNNYDDMSRAIRKVR